MTIELFEWEDWVELYIDGECYATGHTIDDDTWLELLKRAGCTVSIKWIGEAGEAFCGNLDSLRAFARPV